ncbi:MAG: c-type cytochrome, partial [Gemmataceae bacterium]
MRATVLTLLLLNLSVAHAEPPTPSAATGQKLLTEKAYIPAFWPRATYDELWKQWDVPAKPKDYSAAISERYGLHPAPYPNDGLPMGLRRAPYLPLIRGIGLDCMTCHGGRLFGESIVGLGNSTLDIQSVFEDLAKAANIPSKPPFQFCQARGTNEAGAFSVYLLGLRKPDLTFRDGFENLGLHDDACEDVPAWWLLKKKKTMYFVGATDTRSVRTLMQFMMHPLTAAGDFPKAEADFAHIREYLLSIEPPKYPFAIDEKLAEAGATLFAEHCTKCHGTYGKNPTYPNRIIPLREIATDRKRYDNIGPKFAAAYNASWFAQEGDFGKIRETNGYQAPPLDGIWATAPYLHNGSVPTLENLLQSATRPTRFTRSFRTERSDY